MCISAIIRLCLFSSKFKGKENYISNLGKSTYLLGDIILTPNNRAHFQLILGRKRLYTQQQSKFSNYSWGKTSLRQTILAQAIISFIINCFHSLSYFLQKNRSIIIISCIVIADAIKSPYSSSQKKDVISQRKQRL